VNEIIDLPKMLAWFSGTPTGQKLIHESKNQEGSQRKAVIEWLAEVRKQEAAELPPLAKVQAASFDRLEEARASLRAAEAEYGKAAHEHSSRALQFSVQRERLLMELHELTPALNDFLHYVSNLTDGPTRHQMTGEQMLELFRIRTEAQNLWEQPAAELPTRLAALENAVPAIS
jgi:hypothetical protein